MLVGRRTRLDPAGRICIVCGPVPSVLPPLREVRRIAAPAVSRLVLAGLPSGGLSAEEIDIVFAADFDEEADEVLPCLTRLLQDFELVVEVMCLDEHAASARIEVVNE